mgnify:FL=1
MLGFLTLAIIFVFILGNIQANPEISVPVYSEHLSASELNQWMDVLNEDGTVEFHAIDPEIAVKKLRMNEESIALHVEENHYELLAGHETEQLPAVEQHVSQVFRKESRLKKIRNEFPKRNIKFKEFIKIRTTSSSESSGNMNHYQVFVLIGMTLYFTMYTVLHLQNNLIEEKISGTWNRLIFSPVTKTQVYLGHLAFYFLVGVIQIVLSFLILKNLLHIDLGTNYPAMTGVALSFLFSIVSLGILLIGIVPSPSILSVVVPIVSTGMAMLGGAFWEIDVVSNRFILFLSKLTPMRHGVDGMLEAVNNNTPITELIQPIGILMLMGVVFMGIGINLMERPAKNTL